MPDEPDDAEALFTAVHLQASLLALYLIRSAAGQGDGLFGYGEDTGLYARPLDMLTTRLENLYAAARITTQVPRGLRNVGVDH